MLEDAVAAAGKHGYVFVVHCMKDAEMLRLIRRIDRLATLDTGVRKVRTSRGGQIQFADPRNVDMRTGRVIGGYLNLVFMDHDVLRNAFPWAYAQAVRYGGLDES